MHLHARFLNHLALRMLHFLLIVGFTLSPVGAFVISLIWCILKAWIQVGVKSCSFTAYTSSSFSKWLINDEYNISIRSKVISVLLCPLMLAISGFYKLCTFPTEGKQDVSSASGKKKTLDKFISFCISWITKLNYLKNVCIFSRLTTITSIKIIPDCNLSFRLLNSWQNIQWAELFRCSMEINWSQWAWRRIKWNWFKKSILLQLVWFCCSSRHGVMHQTEYLMRCQEWGRRLQQTVCVIIIILLLLLI